jgi:nucleotide-binding universal stress UspA family protein
MAEQWVHEKGLPRICREALAAHLGQPMLLATDLTAASRMAESRAMQIAQECGARLLILATVPGHADGRAAAQRLQALTREARRRGIDAVGRVAAGEPGDCILEEAEAFGAGGIVMGAAHGSAAGGCPCGHVITRARCPVLVTHAA